MSDEVSRDSTNHEHPTTNVNAAETSPARFRIGVVLKIVVPIALLGVSAVTFFGFFDGAKWLTKLISPSPVEATGRVLFNGEPLGRAVITTRPVRPGLRGALATADEHGGFKLVTEINGDFVNGAYVGEHRVSVKGYHDFPSMGEPPLLTPGEYASFDTSPLRIMVASGKNDLRIELKGAPSKRPPGRGFTPGPQSPPPGTVRKGSEPKEDATPPENTSPGPAPE